MAGLRAADAFVLQTAHTGVRPRHEWPHVARSARHTESGWILEAPPAVVGADPRRKRPVAMRGQGPVLSDAQRSRKDQPVGSVVTVHRRITRTPYRVRSQSTWGKTATTQSEGNIIRNCTISREFPMSPDRKNIPVTTGRSGFSNYPGRIHTRDTNLLTIEPIDPELFILGQRGTPRCPRIRTPRQAVTPRAVRTPRSRPGRQSECSFAADTPAPGRRRRCTRCHTAR